MKCSEIEARMIEELSYKHYEDWLAFENEESSPEKWLYGSFGTVRGLMRIPHNNGHPEVTQKLLGILEQDLRSSKNL